MATVSRPIANNAPSFSSQSSFQATVAVRNAVNRMILCVTRSYDAADDVTTLECDTVDLNSGGGSPIELTELTGLKQSLSGSLTQQVFYTFNNTFGHSINNFYSDITCSGVVDTYGSSWNIIQGVLPDHIHDSDSTYSASASSINVVVNGVVGGAIYAAAAGGTQFAGSSISSSGGLTSTPITFASTNSIGWRFNWIPVTSTNSYTITWTPFGGPVECLLSVVSLAPAYDITTRVTVPSDIQ